MCFTQRNNMPAASLKALFFINMKYTEEKTNKVASKNTRTGFLFIKNKETKVIDEVFQSCQSGR